MKYYVVSEEELKELALQAWNAGYANVDCLESEWAEAEENCRKRRVLPPEETTVKTFTIKTWFGVDND